MRKHLYYSHTRLLTPQQRLGRRHLHLHDAEVFGEKLRFAFLSVPGWEYGRFKQV
jgi:hypothetical protein